MVNMLDVYRKRVDLIGIPIDAVSTDDMEKVVEAMFRDGKKHYIVLVSFKDIVRARFNKKLRNNIENASLVLPLSSTICRSVKFLKRENVPHLWFAFDFLITLLGIIEKSRKSIYLIGGRRDVLHVTESNIRDSFPGLNIVGRCAGYFPKEMGKNIVTAIKKSSPTLLLAGKGLPNKQYWITKNNYFFNAGISIWTEDSFDIFAGKKSRPSRKLFGRIGEKIGRIFKNPFRIFDIFIYLWFFCILLYYKIRGL